MWQELCWSTSGVLTSREGGAEATGAMHWAVFKKEEEKNGLELVTRIGPHTAHLQAQRVICTKH